MSFFERTAYCKGRRSRICFVSKGRPVVVEQRVKQKYSAMIRSKIYLYVHSIRLALVSTIEPSESEAREVEILQSRSVEVSKPSTFYYSAEGLWWRCDGWCDIHQSRFSMSESYFHCTHNVADTYLISLSLAVCVYIAWTSASLLAICHLGSVCLRGDCNCKGSRFERRNRSHELNEESQNSDQSNSNQVSVIRSKDHWYNTKILKFVLLRTTVLSRQNHCCVFTLLV